MADHNLEKFISKNPLQRFFIDRFFLSLFREMRWIEKPETILDAGCGEGFTIRALQKELPNAHFTGIDQDSEAITYAKQKDPIGTYHVGNVLQIPFQEKSFDLVICNEVLEHLQKPEFAIRELIRVSKKYLIISVPHEPFFRISNLLRGRNILRFGNYPYHLTTWSKGQIAKLLASYCSVERIHTPFPWTLLTCRVR